MSKYEEVVQVVESISKDAEKKGCELIQQAESLERFVSAFSAVANGTNDPMAKKVGTSFMIAEKELYKAAKFLLEAANAGYEWSGDTPKTLVLKKSRR